MHKILYCSLLALPFSTQAQTPTSSSPTYRAYVGIGINAGQYYDNTFGEYIQNGLLFSPSLVAGVQVLPNLALQLSATTYAKKSDYVSQSVDYRGGQANPPIISYVSGTTARRYFVLPVLARFTFEGTQRVKVDVLLGASVYRTRERSTTTLLDSMQVVTNRYGYTRAFTNANMVLGVGVRYALTSHVEVASELRANVYYFGYSGALPPNLEVGIRYGLGAIKPRSAPTTSLALPGQQR